MSIKEKFSRRQWFTLFVLGSVHFSGAICIALQAPFYPLEAEMKGSTAAEYGLVFGVFELVSFISSPILGKFINTIGAKLLLNGGIFVAGLCSILFGLIDIVQGHIPFISLSFIIRIVEAVGSSAAVTAAFSITATVFPDSVATTFATLEIFYGLGYIVGPTIGGLLYTLGGYILPFVVMGTIMCLDGLFIYFFLPDMEDSPESRARGHIMDILKVPAVVLDIFSITATSMSMGFYSATLEPHLRDFQLSPISVGFVFVISGGMYALTAPIVGRICDTRVYPKKLVVAGSLLIMTSFLLVGPAPFIPVEPKLWMCIVGLLIHGFGIACVLVPCFIDAIRSAVASGLSDDITTYGLVSGLWASSFALGDFIGPSVAGVLFDTVGFRMGTLFIISIQLTVFVCVTCFICCEKRRAGLVISDWPQENNRLEILGSPKILSNGYGSIPLTPPYTEVNS